MQQHELPPVGSYVRLAARVMSDYGPDFHGVVQVMAHDGGLAKIRGTRDSEATSWMSRADTFEAWPMVGDRVILGRHNLDGRASDGSLDNWHSAMEKYVGRVATVSRIVAASAWHALCAHVEEDEGSWQWHVENMRPAPPQAPADSTALDARIYALTARRDAGLVIIRGSEALAALGGHDVYSARARQVVEELDEAIEHLRAEEGKR